jgi:hypothetical protein
LVVEDRCIVCRDCQSSSRIRTLVDSVDRKPGPRQSLFENLGDPAFILNDQQAVRISRSFL